MSRTRKALIVLALTVGVAAPTGVANAGSSWSAERPSTTTAAAAERPMVYAGWLWN